MAPPPPVGTVRQCHTDYNLIFGYRTSATDTTYTYEFPPPTVTVYSPAIVISNLWKTLTTAGPYHRTATVTSNYVWETWATDDQVASEGKELLDWAVKVYCGHPAESDHVEIAEAVPSLS